MLLAGGGVAACQGTTEVVQPRAGEAFWKINGLMAIGRPGVDSRAVYIVDTLHVVRAFAKADQRQLWQTTLPRGGPLLNEDIVVVGNTIVVGDAYLYGLDAQTGSLRWSMEAPERAGDLEFVADDSIVFTGSYLGTGQVFAVRAADGSQRWVANVVPPDSVLAPGERFRVWGPVLHEGTLYACFNWWRGVPATEILGGIAAVDAQSGVVKWSRMLPRAYEDYNTFCSVPAAAGDVVVTSSIDGYVYALDRTSGAIRWTGPPAIPPPTSGPPSGDQREIASNAELFVVGSGTGLLTAYDLDGRGLWSVDTRFGATFDHMSIDDEFVYASHGGGQLTATRLSSGTVAWSIGASMVQGFFATRLDKDTLYAVGLGLWAIRTR